MPSEDYVSTPSTGKLKLKGVKDSKVTKKKRHKSPRDGKSAEHVGDNSIMLKKLEVEDREMEEEERRQQRKDREGENENKRDEDSQIRAKTEAERRYEDQRRKRLDDRLKREGVKTHKQRVEELNRYLSGLSEHHDMPRIGPG